jgi:2-polyprenyl-6-methoxyphenol hydroxylase-like FAD-dependent oxidoreductase
MHDIRTDAPAPRTALVLGAGIGGLTAALALRGIGLDVTVLERAEAPAPGGAGLLLWPNALSALGSIGMRSTVERVGRPIGRSEIRDPDGTVVSATPLDRITRSAGPVLALARDDLHAVLLDALGPEPLVGGARAVSVIDEEDHAGVTLADGTSRTADVLVGADGLHSVVRAAVLDRPVEPVYAGVTSWRAIAPFDLGDGAGSIDTWGRGERMGLVPLPGGRTYWFGTVTGPPSPLEGASAQALLTERFGDWHAPIGDVLAATDPDAIVRSELTELPWLSAWSHERVALLGDAAHAMLPNLGQGAAMAIEDAVILARELARGRRDVETALDAYAAMRRPRVRRVVRDSARLARVAHSAGPLTVRTRRWLLRATPAAVAERRLAAFAAFDPTAGP